METAIRAMLRAWITGVVCAGLLVVAAAAVVHFDRRPTFVMLVQVSGRGNTFAAAQREEGVVRRKVVAAASAARIRADIGVEKHEQPYGDLPLVRRTIVLRADDDRVLDRMYRVLAQGDRVVPITPWRVVRASDVALAILFLAVLVGFAAFEKSGLPDIETLHKQRAPVILHLIVLGMIAAACVVANASGARVTLLAVLALSLTPLGMWLARVRGPWLQQRTLARLFAATSAMATGVVAAWLLRLFA